MMVVTPIRVFLFLVAAFAAATGTAYYTGALDRYFAPAPKELASSGDAASTTTDKGDKPQPKAAAPAAEKQASLGSEDAGSSKPGGEPGTADKPAPAAKDDAKDDGKKVVVPAFDVVRVEPDGSMVVAGRAAPDSTVEVVSGATVVGKAKSGPQGDFAIVLDDPLKPGSHQIVLRATEPDNMVATSKETAVVSVPENENGRVLALVEEPGKPSRLITKPKAVETGQGTEMAANDGGNAAAANKAAGAAAGAANEAADTNAQAAQGSGTKTQAGATTQDSSPQVAMTNEGRAASAPAADGAAADRAATTGAQDATKAAPATGGAQPAADNKPAGGAEGGAGNAGGAASDSGTASRMASAEPSSPSARKAKVFIEAVEIDGEDVFVAGGGEPGQRVRVYANAILLGDAVVSPNGRFLVEARRDLPVGDYIVRADLLSGDGSEVVARAAVPFEREPGEKLAAVAPKSGAASGDGGKTSTGDAAAAQDAGGQASGQPASGGAAASASNAGAQSAAGAGDAASAAGSSAGQDAGAAAGAATASGEDGMKLPDLNKDLAENAPVIQEPKLQSVDGAVIIRRGDTLWQISRRVYGHGTRYSTIYLANDNQIRDPDMIWPGQVFSVPQKTEKGDTADMKAIGDQAVSSDLAGTEPAWRK